MRKREEQMRRKNNGITLIALVITIIVLLILAGVTIATLTGENGILTRASEASEQTEKESLKEEIELAVGSSNIGEQVDGSGNLEEELNKINEAAISKVIEDAYYVERDGNGYTVYEDGTIKEGKVDIWDGSTSEVPEIKQFEWYIYNCNQLKFFADCVNNGGVLTEEQKTMVAEKGYAEDISITEETVVYLMANLDLGARQEKGELTRGVVWTPIGKTSIFNGIFDGNNYSIRGVYVNQTDNFAGFFGRARNLKNITIEKSYIIGTNCMGGLAGMIIDGMENCHNENTTVVQQEGNYYAVGGLAGQADGNIQNCSNTGTIIGKGEHSKSGSTVGGIVGQSVEKITISNCYNNGELSGKGRTVGGIIGWIQADSPISTITNCYNEGEVSGEGERIGGIVGNLGCNAIITNSYNLGKVTGKNGNVGGIAGIIFGTIENSYNKGQIEGQGQVGGIAGQIGMDYEANIRNCYNEGEVIGASESNAVGGIVGWTSETGTSGTIENNYNKGTIRGGFQIGGIIGRNAATFVVTKCYNKGTVEGTTNIGSVIGEQSNGNDNLSKLYYLNTLSLGGVNGEDITDKVVGVSDDINSYEDFLTWIESK